MPAYVALGYREGEPKFMIDFHRQRAMVKTDASKIDGAVHLEMLPTGKDGHIPAVLLTQREWNDIYLVNFRSGWDEDDYFDFAKTMFEKRGILTP